MPRAGDNCWNRGHLIGNYSILVHYMRYPTSYGYLMYHFTLSVLNYSINTLEGLVNDSITTWTFCEVVEY